MSAGLREEGVLDMPTAVPDGAAAPEELQAASGEALVRGACCRAMSLLFAPPGRERLADLRALAPALPERLGRLLAELARSDAGELESEYHQVLGASGQVPACETDHGGFQPGAKSAMMADNAGFYQAFAYDPSAELAECPDHVAVQWGFLGYLALKEALALSRGESERALVCREAAVSFHANHVEPWFGSFLDRIACASPERFLGNAAALAREMRVLLAFAAGAPDPLRVLPPMPEMPGCPPSCCFPGDDD